MKIYLYAKNLEQEKYQNLMKKMREMSRQIGYDVLNVSNDKIIPVNEMDCEDNQKVVIFDDYLCEKNQRQLIDYFIQGRQKLFGNLSQSKLLQDTKGHQIELLSLLCLRISILERKKYDFGRV